MINNTNDEKTICDTLDELDKKAKVIVVDTCKMPEDEFVARLKLLYISTNLQKEINCKVPF